MKEQSLRSFRILAPTDLGPSVCQLLIEEGFRFAPEPFSPHCFRLSAEPFPLGSSLAAIFGYIYIQDRSSMLPPLVLNPGPGERILDMCASPGSKTSFLSQLMGGHGFILANEPTPSRLSTLRNNLTRLHLANIITTSYEGQNLPSFPHFWDAILLDPPCSGWGTVEKNPKVLSIWRGDKLSRLIGLQRLLLRRAAALLKTGGRLLYSTCTTNPSENEEQVRFAEEELGLKREAIAPIPGFVFAETQDCAGTLLVDGEHSEAQGFFVSLLSKTSTASQSEAQTSTLRPKGEAFDLSPFFPRTSLPQGRTVRFGDKIFFLPKDCDLLPQELRFRGYPLGSVHAKRFLPDPFSTVLAPFPPDPGQTVVLNSVQEVRSLLSGRSLSSRQKQPCALLCLNDLPLAWVRIQKGRVCARIN